MPPPEPREADGREAQPPERPLNQPPPPPPPLPPPPEEARAGAAGADGRVVAGGRLRLRGGAAPVRGAGTPVLRRAACSGFSSGAGWPLARTPTRSSPRTLPWATPAAVWAAPAAPPVAPATAALSIGSALRSPQRPTRAAATGGSAPAARWSVGAVAASPSTRVVKVEPLSEENRCWNGLR